MPNAESTRDLHDERPAPSLVARLLRALARDREVPLGQELLKAARWAEQRLVAPWYLADCDAVGAGARTRGRPVILNAGRLAIGARANLMSMFTPLVLETGPAGELAIGDDVLVNFGARIAAARGVRIGDRVMIAPYGSIDDRDALEGAESPSPIVIGDDAWLGARVRVRAGAIVGAGTVVGAGSEVRGELPPHVVAGGVPARVLRPIDVDEATRAIARAEPRAPRGDGDPHGARGALQTLAQLRARLALRGADRVGARPRVHGAPFVENLGRLEIGDDLLLDVGPIRSHLVTGPGALLRIGDGVSIGGGAAIAAMCSIEIGDGARLGRGAMLLDTDFHGIARRQDEGARAPIVVGEGAWLGDDVTVVRGARIGKRAHVASGSTVFGVVADGAWFGPRAG